MLSSIFASRGAPKGRDSVSSYSKFCHQQPAQYLAESAQCCCRSVTQLCLTLRPHELQHARLPCLSLSPSFLRLMSIESVMPSNHLILCDPLLILPSIFPSIRVFSSESALLIRWSKYWSFSFRVSPSSEYSGLISFRIDWLIFFPSKGLWRNFSSTTVWKHQLFGAQPSLWSNSHSYMTMDKPQLWLYTPLLAKWCFLLH